MILDQTQKIPAFGELFITNDESNGALELLKHFRGRLVTSICGGYKKLFIIEEGQFNEGVVSSLHAPEYDEYDYTFTEEAKSVKNLEDIFAAFDNKGQIKKMVCGKKHTVFITEDGRIYSYGIGEYGSLGHGGVIVSEIPRPIIKLQNKKIIQVSCGEFHTLALTSEYDVYAWGRGFEGQLGLKQQTSSVPAHLQFFYERYDLETRKDIKKKVIYITCGSYHSLAITEDGTLYSWGEAKLGQCGTGKKKLEQFPTIVQLTQDNQQEVKKDTSSIKINPIVSGSQPSGQKIIMVSGGYAHTAAITEQGELFCWGFNIKGQLGVGDNKSRYKPVKVLKDILGNEVPKFVNVSCGYHNTFAIDDKGILWSWGGGNIGQKNDHKQDLPRKITETTENRKFTEICATSNSAVIFSPMRVLSVRPNYGPSSGGTLISLLGTGFADTSKQSLRFRFSKHQLEVGLQYDQQTDSFNCMTPKFDDASEEPITWPILCNLEVTLDGKIYSLCEQQFLIYSSQIQMTSINPKCASVSGGNTLTLNINIDDVTAGYLKHLTVGFQRRLRKDASNTINKKEIKNQLGSENFDQQPLQNSQQLQTSQSQMPQQQDQSQQQQQPVSNIVVRKNSQQIQDKIVNPLDLSTNDPELEKENWICVQGQYSKGKIQCIVPQLQDYKPDMLHFNVDISLNGQQFTGQPSSFRFYSINVTSVTPTNVTAAGGAKVIINGEGFFDTSNKKIMFQTEFGERLIDIVWDKKDRSFSFVAPPVNWLLGGQDPTQELLQKIYSQVIKVKITLNGFEWIDVCNFRYVEPEIQRIGPGPAFDPAMKEEDKKQIWLKEEPIEDPLKGLTIQADIDKKKEEINKKLEEEIQEMSQLFKKTGSYLYLHGINFIPGEVFVQIIFDTKAQVIKGVYKNPNKLGFIMPEFDDIPTGIQELGVEVSFNGQQFSQSGKKFKYLSFDKNWNPQERQKFEDDQLKQLKIPPKKAGKK